MTKAFSRSASSALTLATAGRTIINRNNNSNINVLHYELGDDSSSSSIRNSKINSTTVSSSTNKAIFEISRGTATATTMLSPLVLGSYKNPFEPTLPRHESNGQVNKILCKSERILQSLHYEAAQGEATTTTTSSPTQQQHQVFANSYVDLGAITTVGFDYDYTLLTYTNEFLSLIYDSALISLVNDKRYPMEMYDELVGKFDPSFSIKGLAVDLELGWLTHLSYTHKVAEAWEGRKKVNSRRLFEKYHMGRRLSPTERKKRLKPLNDLYSTVECCLIADAIQFFLNRKIPYLPRSCVEDVLDSIKAAPRDVHRLVADNPKLYLGEIKPHLKQVLTTMKHAGKKLFFVSNSPYWYVDAGMKHAFGPDWRDMWDIIIVSAGKPNFYTDTARPFREVSVDSGRVEFTKVNKLEPGKVYTEGCVKELTRCAKWCMNNGRNNDGIIGDNDATANQKAEYDNENDVSISYTRNSPGVLYMGDSLFADMVDAKREFGWTTAAIVPELLHELELQENTTNRLSRQSIDLLLQSLRQVQIVLGNREYSEADLTLLDELEIYVSKWRDEQTKHYQNPFGSVFRARFQPSLFAHSLRRYCDLYVTSLEAFRNYSPQHRFYPEDSRLLGHEKW